MRRKTKAPGPMLALAFSGALALASAPQAARAQDAPPAGVKPLFDAINQLRANPAGSHDAFKQMLAKQDPQYATSEAFSKELINGKTRLQNLQDYQALSAGWEKLSPLEWDASLVKVAEQDGKSNNKLFTPELSLGLGGNPSDRALMWAAIDRNHDLLRLLRRPDLKYLGIVKKPGNDDDYALGATALRGKAYLMNDEEAGRNAYDARLDGEPAWVHALSLKEPNVIPFVRADGTLDVAWRRMGDKQVFLTRCGTGGAKLWTKEVPGVNPEEHRLLVGFTEDPQGNLYVARAMDEGDLPVDLKTPAPNPGNAYDRPELMKLTKLDKDGSALWTKEFAKKGGAAAAFYSPLSASGKGQYGASSRIACWSIKRPIYRLASDETVIVPAQVAEQCLLGFTTSRLGQRSPNRFAPAFQPTEAGGVITPKVKLQFNEEYTKGKLWAANAEAGKPVTFFEDGGVQSYTDLEYMAADYGRFNEFLDANKQGDKDFSIPPAKLKLKATLEDVPLVFVIYGAATDPDPAINNGRHQNAYWRALDARTGEPIEDLNQGAMAHSFDFRVLVTDEGIITAERSDAFMLLGNYLMTRPEPVFICAFNTVSDGNECFGQVGGIALANDGYLFLYAANNARYDVSFNRDDGLTDAQANEEETRQRDLGVLRVKKGFAQEIDAWRDKDEKVFKELLDSRKKPAAADPLFRMRPKYITSYFRDNQPYSAGRPKIVRVADGNYVVFWERWTHLVTKNDEGKKQLTGNYDSVWAMKIDANGNILKPAVKLSDTLRLMRGDDPVLWGGRATFVTGDVVDGALVLHTIDAELNYRATAVSLDR